MLCKTQNMNKNFFSLSFIFFIFSLLACQSTNFNEKNSQSKQNHFADGTEIITVENQFEKRDTILLTFAGDLMAHSNVTRPKNFKEIYEDVKDYFLKSDFTFANLETPVLETVDYSTYPNFNVKREYVDEAINAGINVFCLANNHTNDQGLQGINSTRKYFEEKIKSAENSSKQIYAAGIKEKSNTPLTYQIIEKESKFGQTWKILFLSVTEILNRNDYSSYIDFVRPNEKTRNLFLENLKKLKAEISPDLFVLGFHCGEAEYIRTVPEKQKEFYNQIVESGVDILWINHAHVTKSWELLSDQNGKIRKAIFYGMGNTISGQRSLPNFENPDDFWDYTGDSLLVQLRFEKTEDGIQIVQSNPVFITTYITPKYHYVIKKLDDNFLEELKLEGNIKWNKYLEERKKLMEEIKGSVISNNDDFIY